MKTSMNGRPASSCSIRIRRRSSSKGQINAISASEPDSANMRATSPARRTFSLRSWSEKPRSPLIPWRRLSPSSRKAWPPALHVRLLDPGAMVDLPAPDRPGEQHRRPRRPQRGVAVGPGQAPRWRTTLGLACVVAMTRMTPAPAVAFVCGVDDDEAARRAVRAVVVDEQGLGRVERHPTDLVQVQRRRAVVAAQAVHVQAVLQRLHRGAHRAGRVLQQVRAAHGQGARSSIQHTVASMSCEFVGPVVRPAQHVAPRHGDVVLQRHHHRHRREGLGHLAVRRVDRRDPRRRPRGQHQHLVARAQDTRAPRCRRSPGSPGCPASGCGSRTAPGSAGR